jgi:flagellar basal body rod protein FlgG
MDALTIAAASGMKARLEALEMLANNIANAGSPGYKTDREFYGLYVSPEAVADAGSNVVRLPATLPVIERHWTDFSQGSFTPTGNPLDVALSGKGFFQVEGPSGPLYTRNGRFHLSPAGRLETSDGYPVTGDDGKPILLNPELPVEIAPTGELRQDARLAGRFALVDFAQSESLAKLSGTYFQLADPGVKPAAAGAATHQGSLESANHSPAEAAIRLVSVMRQFEMLQRAVQIGGEMNRRAEEVGRVGS